MKVSYEKRRTPKEAKVWKRIRGLKSPSIRKVGIYGIFCDDLNTFYIGQSQNLDGRIKNHKSLLKSNGHNVSKMQKDYNAMPNSFRFEILEFTEEENLLIAETYYIENFIKNGKIPYNKVLDTANPDNMINVSSKYIKTIKRIVKYLDEGRITIESINESLDNM